MLNRSTFLAATLAVVALAEFPNSAAAQTPNQNNQLDGDLTLFTVMSALQAAQGLEPDARYPVREALRQHLAGRQVPVLSQIRNYVKQRKKGDAGADLSQYVSFALSVRGAPDFSSRFKTAEIPPDAASLEAFDTLMAKFFQEAAIQELYTKVQPFYEQILAAWQPALSRAILEANAYLRNPTSGYLGRRFQIYIDPVGPANQVHTRAYADDFFVVLTPAAEAPVEEVRYAYLNYLLDPLSIKFAEQLDKKRGLIDYAQGAPFLEEYYKSNFQLLVTKCLVKAVEIRMSPLATRQKQVEEALSQGYVLVPYFTEHLPLYEKQEVSMRYYYPDMIGAIDLKKEARRLENVAFSSERPKGRAVVVPAEKPVELTGAAKTLADAEGAYDRGIARANPNRAKDLDSARELFAKALQETEDRAMQARAYYGMARIAALSRDPELAEKLFHKTLELGPEAPVRAWAHVYLGRLADLSEDVDARATAAKNYQAALAVEGAPESARKAAQDGLNKAFSKKN